MKQQDYRKFWGSKELVVWPQTALSGAKVPDSALKILVGYGLPQGAIEEVKFDTDAIHLGDRVILGYEGAVPICIAEDEAGSVWAMADEGPRKINSSLEKFVRFLLMHEIYVRKAAKLSTQDAEVLVEETLDTMKIADPVAFESWDQFWANVVGKMREALI